MTPWLLGIAFLVSSSLAGIILIFLIGGSIPIFAEYGWSFITGREWFVGETYGALPMIYGTVAVTGIALGVSQSENGFHMHGWITTSSAWAFAMGKPFSL